MTFGGLQNATALYDPAYQEVYAFPWISSSGSYYFWIIRDGAIVENTTGNFQAGYDFGLVANSTGGQLFFSSLFSGGIVSCPNEFGEIVGNTVNPSNITYSANVTFPDSPTGGFAYDSSNGYLYEGNGGYSMLGYTCANGLWVLDQATAYNWSQTAFVPIGPQPNDSLNPTPWPFPTSLAYDSANDHIYAAGYYPGADYSTFYEVDGLTFLQNRMFNVTGETQTIVFDPSGNYLYAEQLVDGSFVLFVINTSNNLILGSIPLESSAPIVYDSNNGMIFAFTSNKIHEISGTKIVKTFSEPENATVFAAVYDPTYNEFVTFTNASSSNLGQNLENPAPQVVGKEPSATLTSLGDNLDALAALSLSFVAIAAIFSRVLNELVFLGKMKRSSSFLRLKGEKSTLLGANSKK